jgi:predicted GNAT family acetyltransferase
MFKLVIFLIIFEIMLKLLRTDSSHPDFIELVKQLDAYLAELDGEEHAFYNKLNIITHIKQVVVVYENDKPVTCGAIREFKSDSMEVKRMYTIPEMRGKGIAGIVLLN